MIPFDVCCWPIATPTRRGANVCFRGIAGASISAWLPWHKLPAAPQEVSTAASRPLPLPPPAPYLRQSKNRSISAGRWSTNKPFGLHSLHEVKLGDRAMPTYKFKIGETVFMEAGFSLETLREGPPRE